MASANSLTSASLAPRPCAPSTSRAAYMLSKLPRSSVSMKLRSAAGFLRNSARRCCSVARMRPPLATTCWPGAARRPAGPGRPAASTASRGAATAIDRDRIRDFMGWFPWGTGELRCRWQSAGADCAAAAEHVLADHLDQIHRRLRIGDFLAGLEVFGVAARLQADVALAQQAAGEDAGGGVGGQAGSAASMSRVTTASKRLRVEVDLRHPAHRHAADPHRRLQAQLAEGGEARGQRIGVAAAAELAVGRGEAPAPAAMPAPAAGTHRPRIRAWGHGLPLIYLCPNVRGTSSAPVLR